MVGPRIPRLEVTGTLCDHCFEMCALCQVTIEMLSESISLCIAITEHMAVIRYRKVRLNEGQSSWCFRRRDTCNTFKGRAQLMDNFDFSTRSPSLYRYTAVPLSNDYKLKPSL